MSYHETKTDHTEGKPPVESLSWSLGQRGLEHSWTNRIPHPIVCSNCLPEQLVEKSKERWNLEVSKVSDCVGGEDEEDKNMKIRSGNCIL